MSLYENFLKYIDNKKINLQAEMMDYERQFFLPCFHFNSYTKFTNIFSMILFEAPVEVCLDLSRSPEIRYKYINIVVKKNLNNNKA